jgi:hypothetical protein
LVEEDVMDRRTALATAGAIVIVTVTGAAAIAANLGMLDRPVDDPVGQLQPNDPELTTIVVEPSVDPAVVRPGEQPSTAARYEDDEGEEHEYEEEDHEDDDEGEEHEYEGREDDD